MNRRTLRLKREVLTEIDGAGLSGVVGGDYKTFDYNTCMSCLDYISCWAWQCLIRDTIDKVAAAVVMSDHAC